MSTLHFTASSWNVMVSFMNAISGIGLSKSNIRREVYIYHSGLVVLVPIQCCDQHFFVDLHCNQGLNHTTYHHDFDRILKISCYARCYKKQQDNVMVFFTKMHIHWMSLSTYSVKKNICACIVNSSKKCVWLDYYFACRSL